jgi:RNA polymerase sigma-70 factor (ECF subfamily)
MELPELLARCRHGDELAWEELIRQHQARVYGIALGYTGNAEEARDVAQEVFVRVWKRLDRCPDPALFQPWLVRVARNACVDHLRRRKARPPAQDVPADELRHLASSDPTPAEAYDAESRRRLVYRALQALSEINREMILLKDVQGLALEEIASMLNVPLGTVKSRTNRARLELARAVMAIEGGSAAGV